MKYNFKLQAPLATFLLRIPLSVLFLQQGLDKLPLDIETAEVYDLSLLVWFFVTYGEIGAGIGLLVGGLIAFSYLHLDHPWVEDVITRFSGIVICCIMTGVIWVGEPDSLLDVLLYDNLHVLLWVGGLFFALRGRRA